MAQTTSSVVFAASGYIAYSTNGSSWVDFTGISNKVDSSGGELDVTDTYTIATSTAIETVGNFAPIEWTVTTLYSELAGDYWIALEALYRNKTAVKVKMAPKGNSTGNIAWTSSTGYITAFGYPSADAGASEPIMTEMTVRFPGFTSAAI